MTNLLSLFPPTTAGLPFGYELALLLGLMFFAVRLWAWRHEWAWKGAARDLGFRVTSKMRSCRLKGRIGRVEIRYLWGPMAAWPTGPSVTDLASAGAEFAFDLELGGGQQAEGGEFTQVAILIARFVDDAPLPVELLRDSAEELGAGAIELSEERLRWRPRKSRSWSRKRIVRTFEEVAELLEEARDEAEAESQGQESGRGT